METMRESTFLFSPNINDDVHHLQGKLYKLFRFLWLFVLFCITMLLVLTNCFYVDIHEACLMTLDETLSYVNAAVVARKNGQ